MKLTRNALFTALRLSIGVALIAYLARSGSIEWSSLLRLMSAWWILAGAILLFVLDLAVTAWRLCVLMRPRGLALSLWASLRLTLIGGLFNTCLPGATGGDAVRIYYAMSGNVGRRAEVATIILLDRALGLLGLLLLPLPFALLAPSMGGGIIGGLVLGAAVFATVLVFGTVLFFATGIRNSRFFAWALRTIPLGRHIATMVDTVHAYRHHPGTLIAAVGISAIAHVTTVAVLLLFSRVVSPGSSPWDFGILIPLGLLANSLPITPGGLGVGEAAFDRLFQMAGLAGGIELLLGWRLLTIIGAAGGLVVYLQGQGRYVHDQPSIESGIDPQAREPGMPAGARA